MNNGLNLKLDKNIWWEHLFICMLLPPIISVPFSLYNFVKYRDFKSGVIFFIFFVLFLSYNFYSVDNSLRFFNAQNIKGDNWWTGDFLTFLIHIGYSFNIQTSIYIFVYVFSVYIFWFLSYKNCRNSKLNKYDILIIIFTMILRNAMDLLYYTLSISVLLYLVSRKNNISLKDYIYIFLLIYLLHPGVFIILLPSIILYTILKHNLKTLYIIYLFLLFFTSFYIVNISIPTTGIEIFDSISSAFAHYTSSENKWGVREEALSGITFYVQYYVMSFIYFCIFIYSVKYRSSFKQKFVLSIFQVSIVMLPGFWNFVTISERLLVTLSLTSILCFVMLLQNRIIKFNIKLVTFLILMIFFFNSLRATKMELSGVFYNGTYNDIPKRCLYIPSILLFDYNTWGFSNEFIQKNSLFRFF